MGVVMQDDLTEELLKLRNLGPKSVSQLIEIGISNRVEFVELGVEEVFRRLYFRFCDEHKFSVTYLYALEGAIKGRDWRDISAKRKAELKEILQNLKG